MGGGAGRGRGAVRDFLGAARGRSPIGSCGVIPDDLHVTCFARDVHFRSLLILFYLIESLLYTAVRT